MTTCFHPSKNFSDRERWICIYPAYINKKKTKAEGRLLPKEKCVDNPLHNEMVAVLFSQGLKFELESKMYSREKSKEAMYRGRVRIQLKNDDGTPVNPDYPTRESIMEMLGDMIPKLKSRVSKQSGGDPIPQKNTGNAKKDKGKKKRR